MRLLLICEGVHQTQGEVGPPAGQNHDQDQHRDFGRPTLLAVREDGAGVADLVTHGGPEVGGEGRDVGSRASHARGPAPRHSQVRGPVAVIRRRSAGNAVVVVIVIVEVFKVG